MSKAKKNILKIKMFTYIFLSIVYRLKIVCIVALPVQYYVKFQYNVGMYKTNGFQWD